MARFQAGVEETIGARSAACHVLLTGLWKEIAGSPGMLSEIVRVIET